MAIEFLSLKLNYYSLLCEEEQLVKDFLIDLSHAWNNPVLYGKKLMAVNTVQINKALEKYSVNCQSGRGVWILFYKWVTTRKTIEETFKEFESIEHAYARFFEEERIPTILA